MTASKHNILVCEKSRPVFETLAGRLQQGGVELPIEWHRDELPALDAEQTKGAEVIVADLDLAERALARRYESVRAEGIILLTDPAQEERAEQHLRAGVADYILKPEFRRLETVVRRALADRRNSQTEDRLVREVMEQRELQHSLLENMPYHIFRKDREGRFTYVNEGFARLIGRPVEEILGGTDEDLYPSDLARKYREDDQRVMKERRSFTTVEMNRGADGQMRYVEVIKVPLFDWMDRPAGVQGMFHDVTERVRSQKRLEREATIIGEIADAVLVCHVDGRVEFWNRAAELLYGCPARAAIGRLAAPLMGLDKTTRNEIWDGLFTDGQWQGRLEQQTSAGRRLLVDARCSLRRDEAGEPESIIWVNTEVTDRVRFEEQQAQLESVRGRNELAQGVANDLNSVMQPVRAELERLRGGAAVGAMADSIQFIADGFDCALGLMEQLGEGKELAAGEAVETRQVLAKFAGFVRRLAPATVQVETDFPEDLQRVCGDAGELRQVLLDLVLNACDAMPEGGRLGLSAANVSIAENALREGEEARPGDYVVLSVSDTGVGIRAEDQEQVFQPFYSKRTEGSGSGLGLVSVSRLVYGRGGFVRLQSTPDIGTTFQVFLPVDRSGPEEDPAAGGEGRLLMVVEDDRTIRAILAGMLRHHGVEFVMAEDGEQALEIYRERQSDIAAVMTDLRMPRMDGLELIRELRREDPRLPIAVVTGADVKTEFAELSASLAVNHFVAKPFSVQEIAATVAVLLGREVLRPSPQPVG